jgi:hypothetical protein
MIGVWFTGLITVGLLGYAVVQIRDGRKQREDQTRPFIIVDFDFRSSVVSLAVRNIGPSAASDVRVALDARIERSNGAAVNWQTTGLFSDGVPLFAPGRLMRFFLDEFQHRFDKQLPMQFSGVVEYKGPHGKGQPYREPFTLDLSVYETAQISAKEIADIGDELEKIRKLMEKGKSA